MNVNVPLSQQGVRSIVKSLKELKNEFQDDGSGLHQGIRNAAGERLLEILDDYISEIRDSDGNSSGFTSLKEIGSLLNIRWSGDQVVFLEFGTGIVGIHDPYPDPSVPAQVSYDPQQYHGVNKTEFWYYEGDGFDVVKTYGIPAYAPMYTTALDAEFVLSQGSFTQAVSKIVAQTMKECFGQ